MNRPATLCPRIRLTACTLGICHPRFLCSAAKQTATAPSPLLFHVPIQPLCTSISSCLSSSFSPFRIELLTRVKNLGCDRANFFELTLRIPIFQFFESFESLLIRGIRGQWSWSRISRPTISRARGWRVANTVVDNLCAFARYKRHRLKRTNTPGPPLACNESIKRRRPLADSLPCSKRFHLRHVASGRGVGWLSRGEQTPEGCTVSPPSPEDNPNRSTLDLTQTRVSTDSRLPWDSRVRPRFRKSIFDRP